MMDGGMEGPKEGDKYIPSFPMLRRLRPEDHLDYKVSLGYIVRSCLENNIQRRFYPLEEEAPRQEC